jgi:hypothetical protein
MGFKKNVTSEPLAWYITLLAKARNATKNEQFKCLSIDVFSRCPKLVIPQTAMTKNTNIAEVLEPNVTNRSSVEASVKMHLWIVQAVSVSLT